MHNDYWLGPSDWRVLVAARGLPERAGRDHLRHGTTTLGASRRRDGQDLCGCTYGPDH